MRTLNRRKILLGAASVGAAGRLFESVPAAAKLKSAAKRSADEWMSAWINRSRDVDGTLYLGRFADPIYFLTKPIAWKPNAGQEGYQDVTVPVGFVTDFASIPQEFWSLLRPDGDYAYAAVIHDYLYWEQDRPRDISDRTFKFAMEDFKIGTVTANIIYGGVRGGGDVAWSSNAKLKAAGERRILKKCPTDPRTKWADWKLQPDVF